MKYKFIGTEQDLIENGYKRLVPFKNEPDYIFFEKDTGVYCETRKCNETIVTSAPVSSDNEICFNGNGLGLNLKEYIQDLIDKGLVAEVEE